MNIQGAASPADRFKDDYPDEVLYGLIRSILEISSRVGVTQEVFQHNHEDQRPNATTLQRMLQPAASASAVRRRRRR